MTPYGHPEAPRKALPHFESRGRNAPAPPTKAIAHPSLHPWGLWHPDLQALFLGEALRMTPTGHPEAPQKALPHSECRG